MPRKSRIDDPGALHHIIARGIIRKKMLKDNREKDAFFGRLGDALAETKTPCFAWALIPKHLHSIQETWSSGTVEDPDGPPIIIPGGTLVSSYFDWDIYKINYSYSFFQDDRLDLAGQVGLFIMPIEFGLDASGFLEHRYEEDITAPLPTLGFRMDFAITPKWMFRTSADYFYLEYDTFKGSLLHSGASFEYSPWEHWGLARELIVSQ